MCAGSHLANRELYTCFLRLILSFHITQSIYPPDRPFLDALECNNIPTSLTMDPKPFKLGFVVRGGGEDGGKDGEKDGEDVGKGRERLEGWIRGSEERTAHL